MVINPGVQLRLLEESPTAAGSRECDGIIQSDSVLITLHAASVTGTLDVSVYATTADQGEEFFLFSFPQLTASTPTLLLKRSAVSTSRFRVKVTYSAACSYEIHARAVGAGSSDTKIIGQNSLRATKVSVGITPSVLVAAAFSDRAGILIRNFSSGTIYLAETAAKTLTDGYPLLAGEPFSCDLAAGAEIYVVASAAASDVRLLEAGG